MRETIYTIPVNEAFEEPCGCPICKMYDVIEKNELERITGAAMMEPSVRIETNKHGFCERHHRLVANAGKALPTALLLESYVAGVAGELASKPLVPTGTAYADRVCRYIDEVLGDCYLCGRIDDFFEHELDTFFLLYSEDAAFRAKLEAQTAFCLPHTKLLLERGKKALNKKDYPEFAKKIINIASKGFQTLHGDISWFCKKFDYRYANEDWKNSKDAIPRTVKLLTSKSKDE